MSSAGEMIDALGVTFDLDENQHLSDVVVIGRVADLECGTTGLLVSTSKGIDWIIRLGMVEAARRAIACDDYDPETHDE